MRVWFDAYGRMDRFTSHAADWTGSVEAPDDCDPWALYQDAGGAVRPLPPSPGPQHVWVSAIEAWVDGRSLADHRDAADIAMATAVDAAADLVTGHYPETERRTWTEQERGARAILHDLAHPGAPPTLLPEDAVLLAPIAARRGLALGDLAPVIVAKADAWRAVAGALIAARAAASAAFLAAPDAAAVAVALAVSEDEVGAIVEAALSPAPPSPPLALETP